MALRRLPPVSRFEIPLLTTLKNYQRDWWRDDLVAGLTVCLVMIPSVIAYAELLRLPPITGLYAALAASVGYVLFASSRHVIAGPDAAICLLAGTAIAPLAGGDVARTAMLAAELALLSGAMLLLAARLNLGALADLLARPVLIGYLNGASLVLLATQLGKLFGIPLAGDDFLHLFYNLALNITSAHVPTLLFGVAFIGMLALLAWRMPRVPGALAVSALAIAVASVVDLQGMGVAMVGKVPGGLPALHMAMPALSDLTALAPAAVAIAFLTFSDGILLAQTFADKNRYEINANSELTSLGIANVVAAVWQGFPVSASQSRTAIVDSTGGRTQVAQLVVVVGLLLFLLLFTGLIALLPKVALGAILIVTALRMLEVAPMTQLYRIDRRDFWVALVVMASIVVVGVVSGIILGMLLSLMGVLVDISRPRDAVLSRLTRDGKFHDLDHNEPDAETIPGLLVYRLYAPLIFANARHVMVRLRQRVDAAEPALNWVIIDAQAITKMDMTAAQRLTELCRELAEDGVVVKIADVPRPFREEIMRMGLSEVLGKDAFYVSVKTAVDAYTRLYPQLAARPLGPPRTDIQPKGAA